MKVYELAKKLEVKSVFLMNKIRKDWKLPIKSHMEALTSDMVQQIEKKFYASQKPTTKKKIEKKVSTKKKAEKKVSTIKKASVKKARSTETIDTSTPKIEEKKDGQSLKTKKKFIIRRKIDSEKISKEKEELIKNQNFSTQEEGLNSSLNSPSSNNIRLDLVSVKVTDPLTETFWEDKKEKSPEPIKKQIKKPIAEKDVSSKFNATDFRKREVIFQPRKKRTAQVGEFKSTKITTPKSHKRILNIHGEMKIETLYKKMGVKKQALIRKLKEEGIDTKEINTLDFETISLIVPSFGFEAKNTKKTEGEILAKLHSKESKKEVSSGIPKPPVVTIMGHVDHGKTTLLDTIRKTKVAEGEAGGITQHIGAYSVSLEGKPITFIDTPGHEAFTAMRSRGAQATDIVVIIVSAVDGMKPQTLEALNHAKVAKTPIIIAMSKMDIAGANPDKIKQQMSEQDIVPEDWGGDTSFIPISALKEEGIKELLEQIQILAEMQELKCQPDHPATGVVLEARKEKGFGCVVSLLIKDGTLKVGQNILAGEYVGRIRQMKNDQEQIVKEASSGFPVEAIGFQELPKAGDTFHTVTNEKAAKDLLVLRKNQNVTSHQNLSSEEMLLKMSLSNEEKQELNVILKTDVRGSLEALTTSLEKIKSDEVSLKIIHSSSGAITKSDVLLASTVSGIILGFNIRPDGQAVKEAKEKSIPIYTYSVIYELLDQVKKLMLGLLKAEFEEEDQGQAEVREVFHISKIGTIAGCYVTKGQILKSSFIRLVRDGRLIHDGPLSNLRRFKEDVKQVGLGFECGISLQNFNDIKPKDILESYIKKEKIRKEL